VPRRLVVFKHAFRNALLPIITNIGLYLPGLIGGVLVVELVFSWDGLGYLFDVSTGRSSVELAFGVPYTRFSYPDMPILQALLILSTVATLLANLLADLAYAWLDPRIRYKSRSSG
jgi:peptide/nickel transport system permease protein